MNDCRDDKLMYRIQQGDATACRQLVERYITPLGRFAFHLLGNRTAMEDVVQDTFLRVWSQAHRWRPGTASVSTWLHTITRNLCVDYLRRNKAGRQQDLATLPEPVAEDSETLEQDERLVRLRLALNELPEAQRTAIVLCHHQAFSQRQSAEIMGVSVEAFESLLARARRRLKQIMSADTEG